MLSSIRRFIASESIGGVVLASAALLALIVSNSSLGPWYESFLHLRTEIRFANDWLVLSKPHILWVNDLWMAVFFFLVGLEIKRELLDGELAPVKQAVLPAVAAIGGMLMPALIYALVNRGDPIALRGWAIPTATDIAFALGILMLLGSRVPASLKVFLTAVAIIDDLGAIVVIAVFYTDNLSLPMLLAAGVGVAALFGLNRTRVMSVGPYVIVGLVVWVCVLKSGIHATLAVSSPHWRFPCAIPTVVLRCRPQNMRCTRGWPSRCCRCSRSPTRVCRCKACRCRPCCCRCRWASRRAWWRARPSACSARRG